MNDPLSLPNNASPQNLPIHSEGSVRRARLGGDSKGVSDVEGSPEPPDALILMRRLMVERSTDDDRNSEGRADSLSRKLCAEI